MSNARRMTASPPPQPVMIGRIRFESAGEAASLLEVPVDTVTDPGKRSELYAAAGRYIAAQERAAFVRRWGPGVLNPAPRRERS